jgi:heme-degrading monooxygenase HmoA
MVLLLAYYKVRADADSEALGGIARRMHELVTRHEFGFLGSKDYRGADGDALTIYEFEHLEGLERWRLEPEHLAAQRRGRSSSSTW